MQTHKKKITILILIVLVSVSLVGCFGSSSIEPSTPKKNDASSTTYEEITGSCTVEVKGNKIIVSSDANLKDASYVSLSVTNLSGDVLGEKKLVKSGDNLKSEFTIGDDWGEEIFGFLVMTADANEDVTEVTNAYGTKFEKLVLNENVIYDGKKNIIVIRSEKTKIK